ncbi:MAG: prevent-host-death protein [Spirochaetes bacterium]|nr:prevent-host-death protein [Spirochaetota bacterium]
MVSLLTIPLFEEVSKSKLKARMLGIFRKLEEEGGELIVTDNGRPTLKITPIRQKLPVEAVFADARKKIAEGKINFPTRKSILAPLASEDYALRDDAQ